MDETARLVEPLYITMHERDNVAIVANDGGLPAGTAFAGGPRRSSTRCRRATRSRWSTSPPATRCGATTS